MLVIPVVGLDSSGESGREGFVLWQPLHGNLSRDWAQGSVSCTCETPNALLGFKALLKSINRTLA